MTSVDRTAALAAAEKAYPANGCDCKECVDAEPVRRYHIQGFVEGYLAGCEREPSDSAELERLRAIEARVIKALEELRHPSNWVPYSGEDEDGEPDDGDAIPVYIIEDILTRDSAPEANA